MNISVSKLRVHPAQMRTVTRVMGLAQLALQMRRPDPNLPLLVQAAGDEFIVVSGHRRWLAAMIARLTKESTIEAMMATIEKVCQPKDGLIHLDQELYTSLFSALDTDFDLPAAIWAGEQGAEILGLLRANMGAEEPDLMGQNFCFTQAVAQGYDIEELAQAAGLPVAKAQAIMDISLLQATYQEMLQDGRLNLEIVPKLLALDINTRVGLQKALKAYDHKPGDDERARANYTSKVSLATLLLEAGVTVFDRKDAVPREVNQRLVISSLCTLAKKKASAYYEALAAYILGNSITIGSIDPYKNALASLPDFKKYFYEDWRVLLNDDALEVLKGASCDNCQFAGLPQDIYLKRDLEIPCREKRRFPDKHRCWWWAPQGQGFCFRLPYTWLDGGKEVHLFKVLLKAWQGQQERERQMAAKDFSMGTAVMGPGGEDITAMGLQRAAIRFFMERHDQPPFTTSHPWATTCALCKYHLDGSPVKSDPDAPHCRWAKGRQRVRFEARVPKPGEVEEELPWIPFCYQYAPQESWATIIPHAGSVGPFPRDVLLDMIIGLARSANNQVYDVTSRGVVQFLTGRPETAGNHSQTFRKWFDVQAGDLDDRQVYTLFQWVSLDWLRSKNGTRETLISFDGLIVPCEHPPFGIALQDYEKEIIETDSKDDGLGG